MKLINNLKRKSNVSENDLFTFLENLKSNKTDFLVLQKNKDEYIQAYYDEKRGKYGAEFRSSNGKIFELKELLNIEQIESVFTDYLLNKDFKKYANWSLKTKEKTNKKSTFELFINTLGFIGSGLFLFSPFFDINTENLLLLFVLLIYPNFIFYLRTDKVICARGQPDKDSFAYLAGKFSDIMLTIVFTLLILKLLNDKLNLV